MTERIAGTISVTINGSTIKIASDGIQYNLGRPKREALSGPDDEMQGYKEMPQAPFCSGTGRVVKGFSVVDLVEIVDATVVVELANGSTFGLFEAMYEGEGTADTANAEIPFKFTGKRAEEIVG